MTINDLINKARVLGASDIHLTVGMPLMFRVSGGLEVSGVQPSQEETEALLQSLMTPEEKTRYDRGEDLDFAHALPTGQRQRVNLYHQTGRHAAAIRLLNDDIPTLESLHLPPVLGRLAEEKRGLILVTGPTGSGKSTTLAAMIDAINSARAEHIITVEDPIEYVYAKKKSLIHQREVGRDVGSFAGALRAALREDPDIILVGEMRDYETISAALTAAETGHLVLSTLHTTGVAQTIDRIVDACPASAQNQVRTQLSGVLKGIVTQCLIPRTDGGRIVATEVLTGTDAVLNMIRENKGHQLKTVIQSSGAAGMHTLNSRLSALVQQGIITRQSAYQYTYDKRDLEEFLLP